MEYKGTVDGDTMKGTFDHDGPRSRVDRQEEVNGVGPQHL